MHFRRGKTTPDHSPILVTGAPRSGTTWVGHMLNTTPQTEYIYEPFNPTVPQELLECPFPFHYYYLTNWSHSPYRQAAGRICEFRYPLLHHLLRCGGVRDIPKHVQKYRRYRALRRTGTRPLIKDSSAFFSSEWLAGNHGCKILVIIGHPAMLASGVKRMGWRTDFQVFVDQQELMDDYLHPFESEIHDFIAKPGDPIDECVLLCKLIYWVVGQWQDCYPDWLIVRHLDLCQEPMVRFKFLFERLGLSFTEAVQETIRLHSSNTNPVEVATHSQHLLKRNSRALITLWKERLTQTEITRVRNGVGEFAERFFGAEAW